MYSLYIEPFIGELPLDAVSPRDIGGLLAAAQAKKNLKPQSVLHIYQLLHKMFDDAVEYFELLDFNPVIKRLRPELKQVERPFLSPQQSWVLLDRVREHWIGPATWLMTLAGLRIGETQALRWSSINFTDGYISIRAAFDHKMQRINNYPKQGDWGRAPMPPILSEYLMALSTGKSSDDLVCPGRDGGFHWRNRFGAALAKICKELGLPRVTAHELRHSCTELYIEAGASAEDIRRLLNQSSLTATARYIHRTDERLTKIAGNIIKRG
jgi:integrase